MKKGISITLAIIILTSAFLFISLLVYLSKGNYSLIKKKLKVGAFLLSLTTITSGCEPTRTCYLPAMPNRISITNPISTIDGIDIDLSKDSVVSGKIIGRNGNEFSFRVIDSLKNEIQRDNIHAADGNFDSDTENFNIVLSGNYQIGKYMILFFPVKKENQDSLGQIYIDGWQFIVVHL